MIFSGLFRKIRFFIWLVVIIATIVVIVKVFRWKPEVEKMLKDELGVFRFSQALIPHLKAVSSPRTPKEHPSLSREEEQDEGAPAKKVEFKRDKVRRKGSKTSSYKREEICRKVLEDYFDDYFPTCRPRFLTNPRTGKPLELDGYNARLNLALEHQGRQHVEYTPYFHKSKEDFLRQQERDRFKRQRLSELGIDLLEIDHTIPTPQLKDHILKLLKDNGY